MISPFPEDSTQYSLHHGKLSKFLHGATVRRRFNPRAAQPSRATAIKLTCATYDGVRMGLEEQGWQHVTAVEVEGRWKKKGIL